MRIKNFLISISAGILLLYGSLIISSFYFFDTSVFKITTFNARVISAVWISISAASLSTILSIIIAIPSAYALSRYSFYLKPVVDVFLELPMIISPAALGALILIFFQTPVGNFIRDNVIDVVYTFWGIVLAQFMTVLGISTRMMKAVFDEIPVRYENIARTLGANHTQTFFKISLPLAKKGILSAIILTWAKAIGEFGATITVAGSITSKTETLPTAIFIHLSMADIKGTVALILILFSISMILLLLTRRILVHQEYD